jgi:hypothetical protein
MGGNAEVRLSRIAHRIALLDLAQEWRPSTRQLSYETLKMKLGSRVVRRQRAEVDLATRANSSPNTGLVKSWRIAPRRLYRYHFCEPCQ